MFQATLQARRAFEKHRWRAMWRNLRKRDNRLCAFEDMPHCAGRTERGIQMIRVDQIIGSVNENHKFDDRFNPRMADAEPRWVRLYSGFINGEAIPPIRVYQLDNVYFVEDGHHRVSVARAVGQTMIEAEVTEIESACEAARNKQTERNQTR